MKTVEYNKSLVSDFNPEQIDNLLALDIFSNKLSKCEYWGFDYNDIINKIGLYHFGVIADFHFHIEYSHINFYNGDSPYYGLYIDNPNKLYFHHGYENPKSINEFVGVGYFNYEQKFPYPKTMFDFLHYLNIFINQRKNHMNQIKINHKINITKRESVSFPKYVEKDNLPF